MAPFDGVAGLTSPAHTKEENIRELIPARLEELKKEFETGQAELGKVEKQRTYLRETMLQISGAIQVLQ